jgi:hypothetical protein
VFSDVLWPLRRPELEEGDDHELAVDEQERGDAFDEGGNEDQEAKEGNEERPV